MPLFTHYPVKRTSEFIRIKNLPVREPVPDLCERMTDLLRSSNGTEKLFPIQAQALYDIGTYRGLFGPILVGEGKTLISLLAPRVLESKRPLLLLPASLIEKTKRDMVKYAEHWKVCTYLRPFSYERMGLESAAKELSVWRPDLIIADESHRIKNKKAAVTRRLTRYMREHPETVFIAMSGTIMRNSLMDFAHMLEWTHKENSPLPRESEVLQEWAEALDEKVRAPFRKSPGALVELGKHHQGTDLEKARKGFRDRLINTPGVVASEPKQSYGGSLIINAIEYDIKPETEAWYEPLRTEWQTPDGWTFSEATQMWRHAQELALGFHAIWSPRPPDEWLLARKNWAKFVRDHLSHSRTIDTEKQVKTLVLAGDLPEGSYFLGKWLEIEPTFKVNPEVVWHDDVALKLCAKWLEQQQGICWVKFTFFGNALAKLTGLPYYKNQGLDANGKFIEDGSGPIIASIDSNCTGRNLQTKWSKNLITTIPDTGKLEQLLGRTHRQGQVADQVDVDFLFGCFENWGALQKARSESIAQKDLLNQEQKLSIADLTYPLDISNRNSYRWKL